MKIIHCADIHLDSKMETHLTRQQAAERGRELLQTFLGLIDYAADNGVRAVVIAGDLFDSARISAVTAGSVLDAMADHPEVDFLYLRGNHDESERAFAGRQLPENLKLFGEEWQYHRYGDVVIAGAELTDRNHTTLYDRLKLRQGDVNLVALHGQEAARPGPELVCINALRGKHIRYLALGHLHSFRLEQLDPFGQYAYSGCLEGRGYDECGEKGFVLLTVHGGRVSPEFIPFARRTLHHVSVDITGLTQANHICQAMLAAAADIPREDLVKFTLCGSFTPGTNKDPGYLLKALERRFYHVRLSDESTLALEPETYENDISLKGEFTRLVMASALSEGDKGRVLQAGLQALRGEEVTL